MKKFLDEVAKMEPLDFIGLAHLCGAPLLEQNGKTPRDFRDLLKDVLDKYATLNRKKKREMVKMVRQANRAGEGK